MTSARIGPDHRPAYFVFEISDRDLYAHTFDGREDAVEFIESTTHKCYLLSAEYGMGGSWDLVAEPYT